MLSVQYENIAAAADEQQRILNVSWGKAKSHSFHYVWLRHHARLPYGMENDTSVKIDLIPDNPAELSIRELTLDGEHLTIHWKNDDIETKHGLISLENSFYDDDSMNVRRDKPILWSRNEADNIPVFDYTDLQSEESHLGLLAAVKIFGLARIANTPAQSGVVAEIAEIFGPVHINNYGRIFDVQTSKNQTLGSNSRSYLGPHTDESYRHAPPGISFFHCVKASNSGGKSILVDGFKAATLLKESDPGSFNALSIVPVFFQRLAKNSEDMQARGKIINIDLAGNLEGIKFTDRTFPCQQLDAKNVEPVYRAIKLFWNIINTEEMKFEYLMQSGDLHVFDNHRVLHGRTAFDPGSAARHLQQCSVNRDEFHNTFRLLDARLNRTDFSGIFPGGALG